jgi:uncharacterized phage protein (TIGR02218 family)
MITISPELQTLLSDSPTLWWADLYSISLKNGTVLRYTAADVPVTYGSTWVADGPQIERGDITFETGCTVSQLELTLHATESMLVSGVPLLQAVRLGLFDGADLSLHRAYSAGLGQPIVGIMPRFTGRIGACRPTRFSATMVVDSHIAYLNAPVPRNVWQPNCHNNIYDTACGLSRAAREVTVTVTSVTGLSIGISGTHTANAFASGFAKFSGSGANANWQASVRENGSNTLTLMYPFPAPLQVGDSLVLAPGCAKTLAACTAFGNTPRFRGHPHVPVPETLL